MGHIRAAPLLDPAPMRRLVMSYPNDRPVTRLARFAGQVIAAKVAQMVDQEVWQGRKLIVESAQGPQ
jgi:hypothetical protein